MTVSITLRQEKRILNGYVVTSWVIAADPITMFPVLLVKEGLDVWVEEFGGVADLTDLANYVENALTHFEPANPTAFSSAIPGDKLILDNASIIVPEWYNTYFTQAKFTVESVGVGGTHVIVTSTNPFPTAAPGFTWTLKNSAETITKATGTGAYTRRVSLSETTFLRRHFTSVLANVSAAESRVSAIKTGVQSLVNAANTHGIQFSGIETDIII